MPYKRPSKTLIVGPKKGLTYALAYIAHILLKVIRVIGPTSMGVSLAQLVYFIKHGTIYSPFPSTKKLAAFITAYFGMEAIFYVKSRVKVQALQAKYPAERAPKMTALERSVLFQRCMKTTAEPQTFVESWFAPSPATSVHYQDLKRDNVKELLAWAFFHVSNHQEPGVMTADELEQLENFTALVEAQAGKLRPGYDTNAKFMKFTDEPIRGVHRPGLVYFVVCTMFQSVMAPISMHLNGYLDQKGALDKFEYFYRPGSQTLDPIVFIHGIGVGVISYQHWFREMEAMCDRPNIPLSGRAIFVVHLPVISQRRDPDDLQMDSFLANMRRAMQEHGFTKACVVGHSYGTFVVSWMVKYAPDLVSSFGLIDPVCLLLHSTDTLHNIIYHETVPDDAVESVLDYIMRSEIHLEHHLKRDFYWYKNVLFFEAVPTATVPCFVVLADGDPLVPVYEVKQYIERYNRGEYLETVEERHREPAGQVEVLWLDKCDHSGYLFNKKFCSQTLEMIANVVDKVK